MTSELSLLSSHTFIWLIHPFTQLGDCLFKLHHLHYIIVSVFTSLIHLSATRWRAIQWVRSRWVDCDLSQCTNLQDHKLEEVGRQSEVVVRLEEVNHWSSECQIYVFHAQEACCCINVLWLTVLPLVSYIPMYLRINSTEGRELCGFHCNMTVKFTVHQLSSEWNSEIH
jgi:hypothetical protein